LSILRIELKLHFVQNLRLTPGLGKRGRFSKVSIYNQDIGHYFPEVFDAKIRHPIGLCHGPDLAVATVAGNHQHFGTGSPDLFHFFASVVDALVPVWRQQSAAPASTAVLIAPIGEKIDPVRGALVENPAGLLEVTVTEKLCGFTAVIAGIVVGDPLGDLGLVEPDAPGPDILYQKLEDG
jgi:hypothetical protein